MKLGEILLRVGILFAVVFGALLLNDRYQKRKNKSSPEETHEETPEETEKEREK